MHAHFRHCSLLLLLTIVLSGCTLEDLLGISGVRNFTVTLKTPEPVTTPFVVYLRQSGGSWGLAKTTTTVYEEKKVMYADQPVTFKGDRDLVDGHKASLRVFHPHFRAVQNPASLNLKFGSQENQQGLIKGSINAIDRGDGRYHYEVQLLPIEQALERVKKVYQGHIPEEEIARQVRGRYEIFLYDSRGYFGMLEKRGVKVDRQQFAQRYLDILETDLVDYSEDRKRNQQIIDIREIFDLE